MRKLKKLSRGQKLFAAVFAVLSFVWLCLAAAGMNAGAAAEKAAQDTHVLTLYDTRYNEGPLMVGYFEIDGGTAAMCVCHEMDPPTQTGTVLTTVATCTAENQKNELLRKIYYYGWKGPADVGASFVETCLAGSVANGHDDNYYGYGQAFIDRIADRPAAPEGFTVYLLSSGVSTEQTLAYWEYQPTGYASVKKGNADTLLTSGNSCYTLQGAEYGIYRDQECREQAAVLVTKADGTTEKAELEPGTYYVREKKAPAGYRLDETVYPVSVKAQETAVVEVRDVPVWNELALTLRKLDADSVESAPLGAASLAGARFRVRFYAGYYTEAELPEEPERTWIFETAAEEAEGQTQYGFRMAPETLAEGDDLYLLDEKAVLPLGTVVIDEILAPEGYLSDGVIFCDSAGNVQAGRYVTRILQDGDAAEPEGGNAWTASEQVIRGDLKLVKVADGTQKRLAGIPFRITSTTSGESHVILTDANGQASTEASWNSHTSHTNRGETAEDGVWFGLKADGTQTEPEDERGALPYDTYRIEELSCEANQGYELIPAFEVTVSKDTVTIDLGTLTDDVPEIPEEPEEPETPETPEAGEIKTATVKTGDTKDAGMWLAAGILSCAAILICVMISRITKKR